MNYPSGIKINKGTIIYSNRGMTLEAELNDSNKYYLDNDIAIIHKKPTPIQVIDVDYRIGIINKAYYKTPSTTDYNGIYKGKYIDFEAKESKTKRFPLSNIHEHQINHLCSVYKHGGISFIIVMFSKLNETYLLNIKDLINFSKFSNSKSIPIEYFRKYGYKINDSYNPVLNYIIIVEQLIKENEKYEKSIEKDN